jgi:hypothetical protein
MAGSSKIIAVGGSFADYWTKTIFPVIGKRYDRLLLRLPTRREKKAESAHDEAGTSEALHKHLKGILSEVQENGERRNSFMNLAYTGPTDNTHLQRDMAYEKVANMAADMYLDTRKAAVEEGENGSQEAKGSGDDAILLPSAAPALSPLEILESSGERIWNIPGMVERGYEIPIAILATTATDELGNWKRLGMDIVVNATWLAYYWAVEDGNDVAVSALEALILDWPFDFIRISGTTPDEIEENMFKYAVNVSARSERLRDFIGHRKSLLPPYLLLHLDTIPLLATPFFFS